MASPNVILLEVQPRNPTTGARVTVRLAGGGSAFAYRYGDQDWQAGLAVIPTVAALLDYKPDDLGVGAVPQALALEWNGSKDATLNALAALHWAKAPFTLWLFPENATGTLPATPLQVGNLLAHRITDSVLQLAMADPAADLSRPVITDTFSGAGGVNGPVDWDGRRKRRVWGQAFNIEGEPIDPANNVYAFGDPARPWSSFDQVRDRGAAAAALTVLAWQGSVAATFTALQAASAPAGGGVVAPSIAMVKWWTRPAGILAADVKGETDGGGYVETAPDIAQRIVSSRAGAAFVGGNVAAMAAARPHPCGYVADDLQVQISAALDWLLGGVTLLWVLEPDTGLIRMAPWEFGASVASFRSDHVDRLDAFPPLQARKVGYRRNHRVHAAGDLAAIVTYGDGVPIDDYRPAEAGATAGATIGVNVRLASLAVPTQAQVITLEGTAAAITGQGALATLSAVGSAQITDGAVTVTELDTTAVRLGTNVVRADGTTSVTDAVAVTSLGTAAAITGQGALATLSAVGSAQITDGGVGFAELGSTAVRLGSNITRADGTTSVTDAAAITSLGTAAAITGQGALATLSAVGSSQITDGSVTISELSATAVRLGTNVTRADGTTAVTDALAITSLGTAAAITGQGSLATLSTVGSGQITAGAVGTTQLATGAVTSTQLGTTAVRLGLNITRADGSTSVTDATAITSLGTAAAITAQADWATYTGLSTTTVAGRTQYLSGSGFLSDLDRVTNRRITTLQRADGATAVTEAAVVTSLGIAASITGQGTGATASTLAQLEAAAAAILNTAQGSFVTFAGGSNFTIGYNSLNKTGASGANAISVPHTKGVNMRLRMVSPAGHTFSVLLSSNTTGSAYDAGDYGFWSDGTNLRVVINGSPTSLTALGTIEELALDYDNVTGAVILWRGTERIFSGTTTTGRTIYGTLRCGATTGYQIENILIRPYSSIQERANAVEIGATKNLGEGSLNRNSFFDLANPLGNALSWEADAGFAPLQIVAHAEAIKGNKVGRHTGQLYFHGEAFPVKPGQRIFYNIRLKPDLGNTGAVSGNVRILIALSISDDNITFRGYNVIIAEFNDSSYPVGTWRTGVGSFVLAANYSGYVPRFARWEIRALETPTTTGLSRVIYDYMDLRDQQEAATLGAQAGTNTFRSDGTTVMTQAEIRTLEGVASAITGQGTGATASTLAGLNAGEGAKLAGVEAGADVTANVVPRHNPADFTTVFYAQAGGLTLDGGQLPRSINFDRIRGSTNVSTTATWSIVDQGGITGGTVTVTNGLTTIPTGVTLPAHTVIIVRSVRDGVTIESQLTVIRQDAAAPNTGSGGGTSVSDPTLGTVTTTGYVQIGNVTVKTGSAGTITVGAGASTSVDEGPNLGTFPVQIRIGIRPVGGSYTYQTAATSSPSAVTSNIGTVPEPEYTSSNGNVASSPGTLTGYSANTDYEVTLEAQRTGSSPAKTVYFSGSLTAVGG